MPRLLIAKEKHGDRYFDASTDVQLTQACCKLLRERLAAGYYDPGSPPRDIPMTDAQIEALPAAVSQSAKEHNRRVQQDHRRYAADQEYLQRVQEVLASTTVRYTRGQVLAWQLLADREDSQYESVALEETEMGSETICPDYISPELHFRMEQEGWSIFDHDGRAQVMKLDEVGKLTDDVQAWELAGIAGLVIDEEGYVDETRSGAGQPLPTVLTAHSLAKQLLSAADRPILITDLTTTQTVPPRVLDVRHSEHFDATATPAWLLVPQSGVTTWPVQERRGDDESS